MDLKEIDIKTRNQIDSFQAGIIWRVQEDLTVVGKTSSCSCRTGIEPNGRREEDYWRAFVKAVLNLAMEYLVIGQKHQ